MQKLFSYTMYPIRKSQLSITRVVYTALVLMVLLSSCTPATVEPDPTMGTIRGLITESITGITIDNVNVTTTNSSSSVTSDVGGSFVIENVNPGEYSLIAKKSGYDSDTTIVSVNAGFTTIADIVLKPRKGIVVSGLIRNSITQEVIDAVNISTNPFVGSASTGADGRFRVEDVFPGIYEFSATKGEYNNITKTINVNTEKDSIVVTFDMVPIYGEITGTVRNVKTNTPLAGVNVYTEPASSSVTTDDQGNFVIERVATTDGQNTEFTIIATYPGYTDIQRVISVSPGRTTTADLLMSPTTN